MDQYDGHGVATSIRVSPTGAALGADIEGIDISKPLDDATLATIRQAWADHLVLRFRGQRLDDEQLKSFSAQFGTLDHAPLPAAKDGHRQDPTYISVISNIVADGKPIGGLGAYESLWHTDMSYVDRPPMASALYAIEVPPAGGDTGFANQYLAYESLPDDTRRRLDGLKLRHDSSLNSVGELRRGFTEVTDPRQTPGALHPLVRTHPVTGRKALHLGRRRNAYIDGLDLAESESLLDTLWEAASDARFTWYQQWRVGDLVMWDNRCTLHRRDAFDPTTRRLMHRTQFAGEAVA
jgi:taurine dioxygenase